MLAKDKATEIYYFDDGTFEMNGKVWRVVGSEIIRGEKKWLHTIKNGEELKVVEENYIIKKHREQGIKITTK